jgi:hypothetical protein
MIKSIVSSKSCLTGPVIEVMKNREDEDESVFGGRGWKRQEEEGFLDAS